MISHCTSSSVNPVTWKTYFDQLTEYQNKDPYGKRVGKASLKFHKSMSSYERAY